MALTVLFERLPISSTDQRFAPTWQSRMSSETVSAVPLGWPCTTEEESDGNTASSDEGQAYPRVEAGDLLGGGWDEGPEGVR